MHGDMSVGTHFVLSFGHVSGIATLPWCIPTAMELQGSLAHNHEEWMAAQEVRYL